MFRHPDFADEDIYVIARYCRALTEGPCSEFFGESTKLIEGVEDNVSVVDEGLDPMKLVPNLARYCFGRI